MTSIFQRYASTTNIDDAVALPTTTVVKTNDDINGTQNHHYRHQSKPHHPDLQDALVTTGEITNSTSTNWRGGMTKKSSSIQNNNVSDVVLVEKDQNEMKKPVHNISLVGGDLLKEKLQTTSNLISSNDTALDTTKALPPAQKNSSVPANGDRTNSTLQTTPQHKTPSRKNVTSNGQPTAWICWVGVDEDWEVKHSYESIIKPLDDAGYKIKLGIFLQVGRKDHFFPPFREPYSFSNNAKYDGESLYVNTTFPFNERANWLYTKLRFQSRYRYEFPYGDAKNLTSILLPYINNLTSSQYDGMVHVNHYIPLVNPPTPVDYLHTTSLNDGTIHKNGSVTATPEAISKVSEIMIAKKKPIPQQKAVSSSEQLISRKSFERTVWRVVNHVRDMHSNFLCGRWLKKMRQNTTKYNDQDDLIIRLGEDTRLWQPLNVSHIQKNLKPNQVLTIQAYTNRGHDNDQVEIYKVGSGGFNNRIHVAMMKAYPGIYQKGMFVANGVIKTLADYLRLIQESLGFEVLVWAQRSISSTNYTPKTKTTTTTTWTKLPPLATVLPFNLSSAKLPVPYPLSKHDYIFANDTVLTQPADFATSNETSTTTASNGSMAKSPPVSPIATANNETITSNRKTKRSILVCITGQQERLELENKVKTLLKPMSDEYEIDIVVVLQGGQAIFQRRKKQSIVKSQATTFPTPDDVYNYLTTTSVNLTFANVSVRTYEPPLAFPINPQYLIQKGLGLGFQQKKNQFMKARKLEMVTERIAANLKMMQAYQMCYSKYDKEYDLYLRIREDAGFRNTVPPENYSPILNRTEAFLVPKRLGNGGINDRLAFVTGHQSALCYFHLPFVQMFSGWMLDHAMANTESYFKRLYWMHECPKVRAFPTKKNKLDPMKMFQGRFLKH